MIEIPPSAKFLDIVAQIPRLAPRGSLPPAFLAGGIIALLDLAVGYEKNNKAYELGALAITLPLWLLAKYWVTTSCIDIERKLRGMFLFVLAEFSMLAPAIAGFGILMLYKSEHSTSAPVISFFISLIITGLLEIFLPEWPLRQACELKLISPVKVWAATRGHRWGLATAAVALSSMSKFLPAISVAHSTAIAILLLLAHFVVNGVMIVGYGSVTVAAYLFASRSGAIA